MLGLLGLLHDGEVDQGPKAVSVQAAELPGGKVSVAVTFDSGNPTALPLYVSGTQFCAKCCVGPVGDFDVSSDGGNSWVNGTMQAVTGPNVIMFQAAVASKVTHVRYTANQGFPQCAVRNHAGLPALPFMMEVQQYGER